MCERCGEIESKIEHYRSLSSFITDQRTLEAIKLLINQLKAEKQALHPASTAISSELNSRNRDRGLAT